MKPIPQDLALDDLPGPKRGVSPTLYFRDESVWSSSGKYFALAYTIAEASMCNEIGCILWASFDGNSSAVLGNPKKVYACCWYSPWCNWVTDETFIFKAQHYDGEKRHLPLVAMNVTQGFAVLPGTNSLDSRPASFNTFDGPFEPISGENLLTAIRLCQ